MAAPALSLLPPNNLMCELGTPVTQGFTPLYTCVTARRCNDAASCDSMRSLDRAGHNIGRRARRVSNEDAREICTMSGLSVHDELSANLVEHTTATFRYAYRISFRIFSSARERSQGYGPRCRRCDLRENGNE